jgi:hypothetical protein
MQEKERPLATSLPYVPCSTINSLYKNLLFPDSIKVRGQGRKELDSLECQLFYIRGFCCAGFFQINVSKKFNGQRRWQLRFVARRRILKVQCIIALSCGPGRRTRKCVRNNKLLEGGEWRLCLLEETVRTRWRSRYQPKMGLTADW